MILEFDGDRFDVDLSPPTTMRAFTVRDLRFTVHNGVMMAKPLGLFGSFRIVEATTHYQYFEVRLAKGQYFIYNTGTGSSAVCN